MRLPFLACFLLLTATASAQQKMEIKDHPFFKQIIGTWTSEGDRKYADGRVQKILTEEGATVNPGDTLAVIE